MCVPMSVSVPVCVVCVCVRVCVRAHALNFLLRKTAKLYFGVRKTVVNRVPKIPVMCLGRQKSWSATKIGKKTQTYQNKRKTCFSMNCCVFHTFLCVFVGFSLFLIKFLLFFCSKNLGLVAHT